MAIETSMPGPSRFTRQTPAITSTRSRLRQIQQDLAWARHNIDNPVAMPDSDQAQRARNLLNNNPSVFIKLCAMVDGVLAGQNVDALFVELQLEAVKLDLGLTRAPGHEGTKLSGLKYLFGTKQVHESIQIVGRN